MIKNVVVLGFSHPTALGIVRCLRDLKKRGVKIWIIGNEIKRGAAYYSNIPHKKIIFDHNVNVVDFLKNNRHLFDDNPALYLSTDQQAVEISERRKELEGLYEILLPDNDLLTNFMEKSKFQITAEENNWPVPKSIIIKNSDDLRHIHEYISYPFIVKPYLVHSKKICNDSELERYIQELEDFRYKSMLVQEWINGDDTDVYVELTLSNKNSELIASVSARKIKQYPTLYGTTTSCVGRNNPETKSLTKEILNKVQMVGYCGLEYKYDQHRGKYYIMEPTIGRWDAQIVLTQATGVNLPILMFEILNGRDRPDTGEQRNNVYWIDEFRERQVRKETNENKYWYIFKKNRVNVFFDIRDPAPYIRYYLNIKMQIYKWKKNRLLRFLKNPFKYIKRLNIE